MPAIAVGASTSYFVSAPLICTKLSGCEKFIPAFATGGIRLVFTLDTIANMFSATTAIQAFINPSSGTNGTFITNFELVYDMIDFGPEVERSVLSQPSIMIKSNGYSNSGTTGGGGK